MYSSIQTPLQYNISSRINQLLNNTNYIKKKSKLAKDFELFLDSHTDHDISSATPSDLRVFIVDKDKNGKTQVHVTFCPFVGELGIHDCGCPCRLSWGTVQSLIGQFKTICEQTGRTDKWDEEIGLGNPAFSIMINRYFNAVKLEQTKAHVSQKQAKPLFLDKFKVLCSYLEDQLFKKPLSFSERLILLREVFFKIQFFSGDRAHDLTLCITQEIRKLHDNSGLLFSHTVGKTFRADRTNEFTVKKVNDLSICPVLGLEKYVNESKKLYVRLFWITP